MGIKVFYNSFLFLLVFSFILLAIGMPFCDFNSSMEAAVSVQQCSVEIIGMKSHFIYFKQLLDIYPGQPLSAVLLVAGISLFILKRFDLFLSEFYFWLKLGWYSVVWQPLKVALAKGLIKRKHLNHFYYFN